MLRRVALLALAGAVLAIVLSACAVYKPESFSGSQPGGIGSVRLHLALCTAEEGASLEEIVSDCKPSESENEAQQIIAFAVPKGSSPPSTFSASPTSPGPTLVFNRNQEVAERTAELQRAEGEPAWPPAGDEVVGYLSDVFLTKEGENLEWNVNADIGLPAGADGGSFNSAYTAGLATGFRYVEEPGYPASRPINCNEGTFPEAVHGECNITEELSIGVSDLKITPESPAPVTALVGGQVNVPFKLDFASTASGALPGFSLSGTTTIQGGSASPTETGFAPTAVDSSSHRTSATRALTVKVPAGAKPGTYQATLAAATSTGGTATGTATIVVAKPTVKLGKLKLNKAKGTGTLAVTASATGKLTLSGKGLKKASKAVKAAGKPVKLKVRATGKGLKKLRATGKLKAKAKVSFKPSSGAAVTKSRSLTLKLKG